MKAISFDQFGGPEVMEWGEVPDPTIEVDQLLIEVRAAGVNPVDVKMRSGLPRLASAMTLPFVPGLDVSGVVKEVGAKVTRFRVGDEVFGMLPLFEGGGYAELAVISEADAGHKPPGISHEEAASVPVAALTAFQSLKEHGQLQRGQRVLINGASGGVGIFAVQIAKAMGLDVTAVCSEDNRELVLGLGADRVIDYRDEDFTQYGEKFAAVFDAITGSTVQACRKILHKGGVYVSTTPAVATAMSRILGLLWRGPKAVGMLVHPNGEQLGQLGEWLQSGEIKPVLDAAFPMEEAVDAHKRMEEGHLRGKVVLIR